MPKSACYTLTWSSSHATYELCESQGKEALDILPGGMVWLVWVSQIPSFAFRGQHGSYTARKEYKQRGEEGYWYAYGRVEGKLNKKYLGRDIDLTLAHLEEVAEELLVNRQTESEASRCARSSRALAPLNDIITIPRHHHIAKCQADSTAGRRTTLVNSRPATDLLLTTKLHVPRPRPHVVHRPRLIQLLQQGMERELILISAPAGFGKSTLLSEWLASMAVPTAWLSLDSQDNELTGFLSYLIASLQTYDPHLGTTAQTLLHPLRPSSLEKVLTLVINDLLSRRIGEQEHFVLVLDNYQVITTPAIHHALSFLLEHLPPRMHLVLATREDPPLPLAQLRGRGDLLELRAADLRFTPQETATYLIDVMGLPLSAEQNTLLHTRTEGWITGLQLAASSLQGRDDASSFIKAFSGNQQYVMDYLLQEVLDRQSEAILNFLLQTCILDRLSAPLCDAVLAQSGSQGLLEALERANLFIVPLDDERQWYRYHRLFAQVLRQRLWQMAPTLIPELHLRASRWFEQHGLYVEAVSHALAASAPEEVVRLIERCAQTFVLGSQMQALYELLRTLPETLILANPSLRLIHACALMYTNHLEEASVHLQAVERGLELGEYTQNEQGHLLLGQLTACWSLLARLSGDLEQCVTLSHRALALLPETNVTPLTHVLRVGAMLGAACSYLVSGNVTPESERLHVQLVAYAHACGYSLLPLRGLNLLARLQMFQSRLHQAAATYAEVAQVIKPEELHVLVDSSAYYFGLGELLYEWNKLEAAEQHLARGMDLLGGMLLVDADKVWLGYATRARLKMAQGRHDQALATLDTFMQLAQQRQIAPILVAQCAAIRAHIELARGKLQAARHWANSSGLSANDVLSYPREREYLTLARVRIAEERISPSKAGSEEILFLLERLLSEAEFNMRMHSVLEILLLLTLACEVRGDYSGALVTLGRALALAEPEGYIRLFLDEGEPMIALLKEAQQHGLAAEYGAKLLTAWSESRVRSAHSPVFQYGSLLKPLTYREGEVLQLLLDGASNREIARQLVLSMNTVKKHVLNICRKLNVRSRTQAIVQAQRLHLV